MSNSVLGVVLVLYLILMVFCITFAVVSLIGMYKVFEKAGEGGWKAIIPFYNTLTLSKIVSGDIKLGTFWIVTYGIYYILYQASSFSNVILAMRSGGGISDYYFTGVRFLMLLGAFAFAIAMAVVSGILNYKLGKAFGKSDGWCIAMIFISGILVIAMGFDKTLKYIGPNGVPSSDQYGVNSYDNNNNYYNY